jgi:cysteine synthase
VGWDGKIVVKPDSAFSEVFESLASEQGLLGIGPSDGHCVAAAAQAIARLVGGTVKILDRDEDEEQRDVTIF